MQPPEEQLESVAQSPSNSHSQLESSARFAHDAMMEEDSSNRQEVGRAVEKPDQIQDREMQTSKEDGEGQVRQSRTSDMSTNGQRCRLASFKAHLALWFHKFFLALTCYQATVVRQERHYGGDPHKERPSVTLAGYTSKLDILHVLEI